jgi:outer membrane protein OmpA-like peptidoglycan-associated protein
MDFGALFNTTVGFLDMLKPQTLEKLGPFANGVALTGQAVTAALALLAILFGKSRWAPPTPMLPGLAIIGLAIAVAVGLLVVFSISGTATGQVNLWLWSFVLFAGGFVALLVYFIARSALIFSCDFDPDVEYVAGLWLKKEARSVLKGQAGGLKPPYVDSEGRLLGSPTNPKDYFCRAGRADDFVWSEWSVIASQVVLVVMFWLALTPLPLALFTASTALTQPDLKVEDKSITLPADVLFAFDSDTIRTTAASSLAGVAQTIRNKKISRARIEGHADGRGDPAYNRALSLRRANAVKTWLVDKEGLGKVNFETVGYGADRTIAPETRNGKDDPQGREKNRRVEIQLLQ